MTGQLDTAVTHKFPAVPCLGAFNVLKKDRISWLPQTHLPKQTANKIELSSVYPGAMKQKCEYLMVLFLWTGWDLHVAWFI